MKTDKQWEARARELLLSGATGAHVHALDAIKGALQLGREMADEVRKDCRDTLIPIVKQLAADARAEEIARKIDARGGLGEASWLARSTITKPKDPPSPIVVEFTPQTEAAIRADEREKVAKRIEACEDRWHNSFGDPSLCVATAAAVARAGDPKTRERVLEEALRGLLGDPLLKNLGGAPVDAARRALDWRPDPTT